MLFCRMSSGFSFVFFSCRNKISIIAMKPYNLKSHTPQNKADGSVPVYTQRCVWKSVKRSVCVCGGGGGFPHLTQLLHPPDKALIQGAVVPLSLRGTEPPGAGPARWCLVTQNATAQRGRIRASARTYPNNAFAIAKKKNYCICMHRQKHTHARHTWRDKKKKKVGDTCSKKTLIYIPKCSCQIPPCKKGPITNKWTHNKKEKSPSKSACVTWIFYANGISNEVELSSETLTVFPQPSIKIYATADL